MNCGNERRLKGVVLTLVKAVCTSTDAEGLAIRICAKGFFRSDVDARELGPDLCGKPRGRA